MTIGTGLPPFENLMAQSEIVNRPISDATIKYYCKDRKTYQVPDSDSDSDDDGIEQELELARQWADKQIEEARRSFVKAANQRRFAHLYISEPPKAKK